MAYDFNNQAVAEHFALRETMKLLKDDNLNFLTPNVQASTAQAKSSKEDRKWLRNTVIQMVLATDMSKHFDLLSQFETKILHNKMFQKGQSVQEMWADMDDNQRILVLNMAIKVSIKTRSFIDRVHSIFWIAHMGSVV
jgi:DNA polymerase III gamma/tau subunit